MTAIEYWLWLSTSAKLSPRAKAVLLAYYGSPEAMFEAPKGEITKLLGNRSEGAEVLEKRDLSSALRTIDVCNSQNISIITTEDAEYPARLKNIYAPPLIIYVKGKLPKIDEEAAIAVIGTRNASPYGIRMGRKLGYEIAKCGGVVVSGLTKGIDAAGAEGALLADGKCVGVLGVPHELSRGKMSDELAVRGALVSEYPPGAGMLACISLAMVLSVLVYRREDCIMIFVFLSACHYELLQQAASWGFKISRGMSTPASPKMTKASPSIRQPTPPCAMPL